MAILSPTLRLESLTKRAMNFTIKIDRVLKGNNNMNLIICNYCESTEERLDMFCLYSYFGPKLTQGP